MIHPTAIEASAVRTWPSTTDQWYDGWLLRFSDGSTRRATSVNPLRSSQLPIPQKIAYAVAAYHGRGLDATFRMTPLVPTELTRRLDDAGFSTTSGALVMTRPLDAAEPMPNAVSVDLAPTAEWIDLLAIDQRPGYDGAAVAATVAASGLTVRYATVHAEDGPAAIGMVVLDGPVAAVFAMRTRPEMRRRGHARKLLAALNATAAAAGAVAVYLQVVDTNEAARSLYESEGFTTRYEYHYRVLTASGVASGD